jgi:CheY-like chemotaxis protein
LLNLINDILDMAKIEAGRVVIEPEPFDLGETIRDIVDMMRERAENKHLQLLHVEQSNFPRFVEADSDKLRQILINLIGNAIKYTEKGTVTLWLNAKDHADADKICLICEVEDTGVGISREDQEKIFEPFVQVGKNSAQKGTGLGLPITQKYITLMGGTLSVTSEAKQGSLFRVELPVRKVSATEIMAIKPAQNLVIGLAPNQILHRLLIVDDNLENRLLLKKILQPLGFPLREACNGLEAVEIFQQWQPHLIWMDIRMPVMNGAEATRRIKALPQGKNTVIVALTASVFEDQREKLFQAGIDAFMSKPYRVDDIFACLHEHLKIEFIYQQTETPPISHSKEICGTQFKALPETLQKQLYSAAAQLDIEETGEVISLISELDSHIAKGLQQYLQQMDFQAILNLCKSA